MRDLNLPELPDRYFWRITTLGLTGTTPVVGLMRRRRWLPSEVVKQQFSQDKFEDVADEVEHLALSILDELSSDERRVKEVDQIVGDYGV